MGIRQRRDQNHSVPVTPCNSFHLFPNLPAELRLKIWHYSLPEARIVPIRCGASSLSPRSGDEQPRLGSTGCTSPAPIPAGLHTCHESRSEALRRYELLFGIARQPGRVFFDPGADVLYFGPRDGYMASEAQFRTVLSLASPAELARVRRVAVDDAFFWPDSCYDADSYVSVVAASLTVDMLRLIRLRLPGVEELILVPRGEARNTMPSEGAKFVQPTGAPERIWRQVRAAMETVQGQFPEWRPPRWRIMAITA